MDPISAARALAATAAEQGCADRAGAAAAAQSRARRWPMRPFPPLRSRRARVGSRRARPRSCRASKRSRAATARPAGARRSARPAAWSPATCRRRPRARCTPTRGRVTGGVFAPMGTAVPRGRRLQFHGHGPLAVRERLPALRLADGRLPRARGRRRAHAAGRRARHSPDAHPREHRDDPRHVGHRRACAARAATTSRWTPSRSRPSMGRRCSRTSRSRRARFTRSRCSACSRWRSVRSASGSPKVHSTTSTRSAEQRVPTGGRRSVAQRPTAQAQVARAEAATRAARALCSCTASTTPGITRRRAASCRSSSGRRCAWRPRTRPRSRPT